jgi:BCD family chlorophyll transporter-like MFS transporter
MIPHSPKRIAAKTARSTAEQGCFRGRARHRGFYISTGCLEYRHEHAQAHIGTSICPSRMPPAMSCRWASLLRCRLFQVSVGMAAVMLLGTLNRVMIVELQVPAFLVAAMIALPVLIAPFRALLGFRRTPTAPPSGGSGSLSLVRHALAVRWPRHHALRAAGAGRGRHPCDDIPFAGEVLAGLAFLMTGLGMHMTQTAGLALAADRATDETRPGSWRCFM